MRFSEIRNLCEASAATTTIDLSSANTFRQTSKKRAVYLTPERSMAAAYANGRVSDAHMGASRVRDGVIFKVHVSDDDHDIGGDVWDSYRDDVQKGAKAFLAGKSSRETRFLMNGLQHAGMELDKRLATQLAKRPDDLLGYLSPQDWCTWQQDEQGYAELAVDRVPWSDIVSITEYDSDGDVVRQLRGGYEGYGDEEGYEFMWHGAPAHYWAKTLDALAKANPKLVVGDDEDLIEATSTSAWLAKYLSQTEPDPYDFQHLLSQWIEDEDIEVADPDDLQVDDLTDEQRKEFAKWLSSSRRPHDEEFYEPPYLTMSFVRHVAPDEWLVHFTDDPESIAENGFRYGSDIDGLHLTTWRVNRKVPGEFAFAFEADSRDAKFASRGGRGGHGKPKYGKHAVLFQSPAAILATHFGDEERQVVFDREQTRNRVPVMLNPSTGEWEVSTMRPLSSKKDNRVLYSSEKFEDVVSWVYKNFSRYGNLLMWRGEKGKISPVKPEKSRSPVQV